MARTTKPVSTGADWTPEQTLRVLRKQLLELAKLKGRIYRDAEDEEQVWKQIIEGAFIHGFGSDSHNVNHYYSARSAGSYSLMGNSPQQLQANYEKRIAAFEATLKSSIAEIESSLPEASGQALYEAGDEFAFYKELKDIVASAEHDIFIVDNYLNTEFFELYVEPIRPGVPVRIMTNSVSGNLQAVGRKYASRGSFELRSSPDVHDRHVFVDGRGWLIGQSIKDAAKKKPTYMVEIDPSVVSTFQRVYEEIWQKATSVVTSPAQ